MELTVPVWTAGLTLDDCKELERVQKTACAIILGRSYNGYQDALEVLQIKSLKERRKDLCLSFAKKAAKSDKYKLWFTRTEGPNMLTRSEKTEYIKVPQEQKDSENLQFHS